jgi:transitional endoplasmic reticulum ATPase
MKEHRIIRHIVCRIGRGVPASAPLARAIMEWAEAHQSWLLGDGPSRADGLPAWEQLLKLIAKARPRDAVQSYAMRSAQRLAKLLALNRFDAAFLAVAVACDRQPRVAALVRIASVHGVDIPSLLGELAGAEPHDAGRVVRRSHLLRLGLVSFRCNRQGQIQVDIGWTLERLLDRAPAHSGAMIDMLVGIRQSSSLSLADFSHVDDAEFLVRLLKGAIASKAEGINILIHGPPGTGKTELARTMAAAAGATLHAVGEADDDGAEPNRWDRLDALQLAQRVMARRGKAALLFDEMEDLIGDTRPAEGDWFTNRQGSKIFVNRLLETNAVPVIWTTNAIGNVDPAILRRMSFVLKLALPSRLTGQRMLDRIAVEERTIPADGFDHLLEVAPESATVLRVAARAARLADDGDAGVRVAQSLVQALRGGPLPLDGPGAVDLSLYEADLPIAAVFDLISGGDSTDVSLLLTGPPGTGKTALAHDLARRLDRPLIVKRASDLLSKWVGQTEANIANAFAEARDRDGVLLFDEADSLLFDRTTARTSWEVGQVNELLTWLDRHPLPVVAATNHATKPDPATLRRFVFKIDLRPLGAQRSAAAFERFFGVAAPAGLARLTNLTPGDFAVVARQLRHLPATGPSGIVARLQAEGEAKPLSGVKMGF